MECFNSFGGFAFDDVPEKDIPASLKIVRIDVEAFVGLVHYKLLGLGLRDIFNHLLPIVWAGIDHRASTSGIGAKLGKHTVG